MKNILKILDEINNKPHNDALKFTPKIYYLEQDMENQRFKNIVIPMLPEIEEEINGIIFNNIKLCKNVQDADMYFELLHKIQGLLCRLWNVEDIDLSSKMKGFIRDCDRLDDPWLRNKLFNAVQDGTYNYDLLRKRLPND